MARGDHWKGSFQRESLQNRLNIIFYNLTLFPRSLTFLDLTTLRARTWDWIFLRSQSRVPGVYLSSESGGGVCTAPGARARRRVTHRTATQCRRGSPGRGQGWSSARRAPRASANQNVYLHVHCHYSSPLITLNFVINVNLFINNKYSKIILGCFCSFNLRIWKTRTSGRSAPLVLVPGFEKDCD